MNGYEKLILQMRNEGKGNEDTLMQLGEVLSKGRIQVGELKLDTDDYRMLESVGELQKGDIVLLCQVSEEEFIVIGKVI